MSELRRAAASPPDDSTAPANPLTATARILVVKLADLGDALTVTPCLRALRSRYPRAQIDVLTTPIGASILDGLDSIDRTIVFDKHRFDRVSAALRPSAIASALRLAAGLGSQRYDAVLLCHHLTTRWGTLKYAALVLASGAPRRIGLDNGRGWFLTERVADGGYGARHEVDYWRALAERLDARLDTANLEIALAAEAEDAAARLLDDLTDPIVVVHPGGGTFSVARRWPVERFAAVADRLASDGASVVVVGGRDEVELAAALVARCRSPIRDVSGLTTPKVLAAVLRRACLFVGNDSGVMHMAVAVGTPVVAVFGLSNHRAWGPYGAATWSVDSVPDPAASPVPTRGGIVVRRELPCSPCFYRGHALGLRYGCATRHCLTGLDPDPVLAAARKVLASRCG